MIFIFCCCCWPSIVVGGGRSKKSKSVNEESRSRTRTISRPTPTCRSGLYRSQGSSAKSLCTVPSTIWVRIRIRKQNQSNNKNTTNMTIFDVTTLGQVTEVTFKNETESQNQKVQGEWNSTASFHFKRKHNTSNGQMNKTITTMGLEKVPLGLFDGQPPVVVELCDRHQARTELHLDLFHNNNWTNNLRASPYHLVGVNYHEHKTIKEKKSTTATTTTTTTTTSSSSS